MKLIWDLFYTFFKMGLFTFGGGLAMLPLISDLAVNKKKWLSEDESVDCMALCQALPGVIAINAAIYIGNRQKGFVGAAAAAVGVILPSFTIIILVVLFLGAIEENPYVNGAFEGIKAATAGLIAVAAYNMGKKVLKMAINMAIAIISFLLIVACGFSALWAIVFGGMVGFLIHIYYRSVKSELLKKGGKDE